MSMGFVRVAVRVNGQMKVMSKFADVWDTMTKEQRCEAAKKFAYEQGLIALEFEELYRD